HFPLLTVYRNRYTIEAWHPWKGTDAARETRRPMAKSKDDSHAEQAEEKPLILLHGEIKTPPFTAKGRREAGWLLGQLQQGLSPAFPQARPMPSIGPRGRGTAGSRRGTQLADHLPGRP